MFFDLLQDGHKVQVMYNLGQLNVEPAQFMELARMLRRGDAICMFIWSDSLSSQPLWLIVVSRNR